MAKTVAKVRLVSDDFMIDFLPSLSKRSTCHVGRDYKSPPFSTAREDAQPRTPGQVGRESVREVRARDGRQGDQSRHPC
jgi:hypothetical protein